MSQASGITSLNTLIKDEVAQKMLKAEKYEEALNQYIDMLEDEPSKAEIHSNIGVIMAQTQKPEDALKSMRLALKLAEENKDFKSQFAVNFNLGAYYGGQKNIAEALHYYQAALDMNPTSKETKTNIELLIQSQSQGGKGESQNKQQDQKQDSKDQKDQKDQNKDQKDQNGNDKKDEQKDQKDGKNDNDNKDEEQKPQEKKGSAKYKPRPYQGDQLSEGDVKKILGELRNQEQKIRANFDKKEKKDSGHEKNW
jgi:tetratricopeptide (TPR) repeat protein